MWKPVFLIVVLIASACSSAEAAIIVSFTGTGAAPVPLTISVGDTVDLDVYLAYDGVDTNYLDEGLLSAGINVSYTAPGIVNVDPFNSSIGPGWDPFSSAISTNNAGGITAIFTDVGLLGAPQPPGNSVLIGTLRFEGIAAGTATLSFSDLLPDPSVDTITNLGTQLDGILDYSQTHQITVLLATVPEPVTGLPIALVIAGSLWQYRRRSRIAAIQAKDETR